MSESIAEMVIPGTYIEVRAEGLISVGSIDTGNIGVVGTAARGPRNGVVELGSYADALDAFGAYDAFDPNGHPLTLTRTIEQLYRGGAGAVYAVRIANGDPVPATATLKAEDASDAFTLTAGSPDDKGKLQPSGGSWGNAIQYQIVDQGSGGTHDWHLTIVSGATKETFTGADVGAVHDALATSKLAIAGDVTDAPTRAKGFTSVPALTKLTGGDDHPAVTSADVADGLAALAKDTVNILVVGGIGSDTVRGVVAAHLGATENDAHERIAIVGASASDAATVKTEADALADKRIVLVAPGMKTTDATGANVTLPPSYLAAVVAGRLSTLAPEISLTNKAVPVDDLDVHYNTTVVKSLLQDRVLVLREKFGFQVVKAITTENPPGAFKQISIRRIVDYAKAGVRLGADPYIGRLNNARIRAALKATLDGFLSQMVLDEMLVSYELSVTATRAQEIQGIAVVAMTLVPTFSIDYIRVTMTLQ